MSERVTIRDIEEPTQPQRVFLLSPQLAYDKSLELWDTMVNASPKPKAIILGAFGSGSLAAKFIPKIADAVRSGIAVFLLSSMHRGHGIEKVSYGIQEDALKAGAVHLESVNEGHLHSVGFGKDNDPRHNVVAYINQLANTTSDVFELMRRVNEEYRLPESAISGSSSRRDVEATRAQVVKMIGDLEHKHGRAA